MDRGCDHCGAARFTYLQRYCCTGTSVTTVHMCAVCKRTCCRDAEGTAVLLYCCTAVRVRVYCCVNPERGLSIRAILYVGTTVTAIILTAVRLQHEQERSTRTPSKWLRRGQHICSCRLELPQVREMLLSCQNALISSRSSGEVASSLFARLLNQ